MHTLGIDHNNFSSVFDQPLPNTILNLESSPFSAEATTLATKLLQWCELPQTLGIAHIDFQADALLRDELPHTLGIDHTFISMFDQSPSNTMSSLNLPDITYKVFRASLATFFNNTVETFKAKAQRASSMDVTSFLAKPSLKLRRSHTITSQNKIFEDFGFAQSSIPLGHLRIFIEVPDFVDTSIPTSLIQATQLHLIFGGTFRSSNLYFFQLHCYDLFCEICSFNPLLDEELVRVGGSYFDTYILFHFKPSLRIYFVDGTNEWLIGRAHRTNKFLFKLVKGTHCHNHLTTIHGFIYYHYLVLEPGASSFASNRN